jgi:4-hydroxymandelate oxidase
MPLTRREALCQLQALLLASPLLRAQTPYAPERIAPLAELLNALEFETAARQKLPKPLFDHIAGGAGDERTLRRNRDFFERITFRPRMLVDVANLDLSVELFGETFFTPLIAGPSALQGRAHPEGEVAVRQGAAAARALAVVSERSSMPLPAIARAADSPWWYQLSPDADLGALAAKAARAAELGAKALVLTVGAEARPRPDADVHNQEAPGMPGEPASRADAAASLRRLKDATALPVVVKGVLSPLEARAAVEAGAGAVCVSNHGGRVVDGAPATIEALPAVVDAVGAGTPVLVDGGFRRGSDALKALAYGARGVLLGRPILWGLAAWGAPGVQRLLELMQSELALAMGLSGQPSVAGLNRDLVKLHRW